MLNQTISELLNKQITKELHSAYVYLDISNYYDSHSLIGFSNWFDLQAQEELDHAKLFIAYLRDNGEKITLETIKSPQQSFQDFRKPLDIALQHEKHITQSINEIYEEAHKQNDFRTMQFLNWFVQEQMEEEKNAEELCSRFDLFGKDSKGLYMIDKELGERKVGGENN